MLGVTETEKEQWLAMDKCETGVQNMTDEDIIAMVQSGETEEEEEDEDEEPTGPTITHTEAEEAFSTCLAWLEQQDEATPMILMLLRELQSLAVKKKYDSLKQTHITDYFKFS